MLLAQTTGSFFQTVRQAFPTVLSQASLHRTRQSFTLRQSTTRLAAQGVDREMDPAAKKTYRRPEVWVKENKPVNLLVLGPIQVAETEAVVAELGSLVNIQGRGLPPDDFQHMSAEDWEKSEVLFVLASGGQPLEDVVQRAKNLRWIHVHCTGIERLMVPSVLASDIPVTNTKHRFSHSLAEFALFACNYFAKDLPRLLKSKTERKWDAFAVQELRGRTMGIIGLGDIGKSTAAIAKAFKMKVIGIRRNPTLLDDEERHIVDEVYGPEELTKVMGMSDYVVVALPQTEKTTEMIDAAAVGAMQPHAVFINVGRGKTVDEPALIKALKEKRIKGAALDVFQREPLPKESPLYDLDNVLISSHTACRTGRDRAESVWIFKELLQEYVAGFELRYLVDVQAGY